MGIMFSTWVISKEHWGLLLLWDTKSLSLLLQTQYCSERVMSGLRLSEVQNQIQLKTTSFTWVVTCYRSTCVEQMLWDQHFIWFIRASPELNQTGKGTTDPVMHNSWLMNLEAYTTIHTGVICINEA